MEPVPLAARVVEVIADLGGNAKPRYRYGSGCVVRGRTVLTAAHVLADAAKVQIRGLDKVLQPAQIDPQFIGGGQAPDLALIEVEEPVIDVGAMELAAVDRESTTGDLIEGCHAIGYPWFMERPSPTTVRETAHCNGYIPVLSGLVSGLLTVEVTSSPRPLPPERTSLGQSEWSGMSGAPVVVDGCLLGVVTEHAARQGASTITATPITSLESNPEHPSWGSGVSNSAQWWARLGVSGVDALRQFPVKRRRRTEPVYWATLRQVHRGTPQLLARSRELRELADFAVSQESYRWLVGGAWAGKTALAAEAVTAALPTQVDVVAYFMSRRAADADSDHFLAAVIPQLAYLLEEDLPVADRHAFLALWQRSVDRAKDTDRHLLLVVDGLDEDLHPAGSRSVAELLPQDLSPRTHILVTSRPHPELPVDVSAGHPLRQIRPIPLEQYEDAADRSEEARQEINDLLHRGNVGLAVQVLGVLTAAAGPLAVSDLVALTTGEGGDADRSWKIRRLLTEEAARSLERVGPPSAARYQFAHSSLLEYAQEDDDLRHPDYRERINQWVVRWRDAGWPPTVDNLTGTPQYLLDKYAGTLGSAPSRLAALVSDIGWVAAAIQVAGVDSVLASLRTAISAVPGHEGVFATFAVVLGEAHRLRPPEPVGESGYVLRQICLHAAELTDNKLAADARVRLQAISDPNPIPIWTTRRASRSLSAEVVTLSGSVRSVAMLPDGRVVTGGSDRHVRVWDPNATESSVDLGSHGDIVRAVAALPDGRVVTGGDDRRVLVWDPAVRTVTPREIGRHGRAVRAIAVLPDGRVVTGGDDWRVMVWDSTAAGTRKPPVRLGGHDSMVLAVAVLPDGRVVTGGDDRRILMWDPDAPGTPAVEIGRHPSAVRALAVRHDGRRVVSGGDDQRVRMWDPATPRRLIGLARHGGEVTALAVLKDGRVVSGGKNWIKVFDFTPGGAASVGLGSHDATVRGLAVLPDGRVVTGGDDRRVRMWDPSMGGIPITYRSISEAAQTIAILPDGRVISGGRDHKVLLWDPAEIDSAPVELGQHEGTVGAVAVLPDGRIVSGGYDHRVLLWDPTAPGAAPMEIGRHRRGIGAVVALPDGRVIVSSGDDQRILVCDPATKSTLPTVLGYHSRGVGAVAVLLDGRVVTGGYDRRILLWDPAAIGKPPVELGRHGDGVRAIAVLPDGRVVTGGDDRRIRMWDPARIGAGPIEVGRHDGGVLSAVTLPDGKVITSGDDRHIRIWDAAASLESARVSRSAIALAVGPSRTHGDWQLVMVHEGGEISGWSIRAAALHS